MTLDWAITHLMDEIDFCWLGFLYRAYVHHNSHNMEATAIEVQVDKYISARDENREHWVDMHPSNIDHFLTLTPIDVNFDFTTRPATPGTISANSEDDAMLNCTVEPCISMIVDEIA